MANIFILETSTGTTCDLPTAWVTLTNGKSRYLATIINGIMTSLSVVTISRAGDHFFRTVKLNGPTGISVRTVLRNRRVAA